MGRNEEKKIERFMEEPPPKNMTMDEFKSIVKIFGFFLDRTKGSHYIFKHNKYNDLTRSIPYHDKAKGIKPVYIKEMQSVIKEIKERNDEQDSKRNG